MKLQVTIPDSLFAETQTETLRRGISTDALVVDALEELLRNRSTHEADDEIAAAMAKFYSATPEEEECKLAAFNREATRLNILRNEL